MQHAWNRHDDAPRGDGPTVRRTVADLVVRNHDFDCGYDLAVTVEDGERVVFEVRCYVGPGQWRVLDPDIAPGLYDVTVTLDGERADERQCPVGETPEHSVLVECGNGCVAVTPGLC